VKVLRFFAVIGGFLSGAIFIVMASGLCNPASYDLDFVTSGFLTFALACFYGVWEHPVVVLGGAVVAGVMAAFATRILFQKQRSSIAWCVGGAGYGLLLLTIFTGWTVYQMFIDG
jgi:hypothetical protein